jgi:hypothetical protein
MKRENGFYWVILKPSDVNKNTSDKGYFVEKKGWQIACWYDDAWSVTGSDEIYYDINFYKIGEKIIKK